MPDVIWGDVTEIIDGDSFRVDDTSQDERNEFPYGDSEEIRIQNINAPELPSKSGKRAKEDLEALLSGKRVRLTVHARDDFGRLICDISFSVL